MKDRAVVVARLCQSNKVLTGSGGQIAVQFHVDVSLACVKTQVPLLLGIPLYTDHLPLVLRLEPDRRAC